MPILMYHRIDALLPTLPAVTHRLTVDPKAFARQMAWLNANGWHAITQSQLYAALAHGERLPRRPVLITFDDGYRDVFKAVPALRRFHMPATEYVITERLRWNDPDFLTWPQLRRLERTGVEIGSHTITHAELPSLDNRRAYGELAVSKRVLERGLGHPVPWLAYPAGREDPRIVRLARRAGYLLAVTTQPGREQRWDRRLRLSRYRVLDTTRVAGLAGLLG